MSAGQKPQCELWPGCTSPLCNTPEINTHTSTQEPFWENHTWTFKSFKSHLFSGFWKLFFKFWNGAKCFWWRRRNSVVVVEAAKWSNTLILTWEERSSSEPISTGFWKRISSTATRLGRHPLQQRTVNRYLGWAGWSDPYLPVCSSASLTRRSRHWPSPAHRLSSSKNLQRCGWRCFSPAVGRRVQPSSGSPAQKAFFG